MSDDTSRDLHPPIKPNRTARLNVGDGHNLYVEDCGTPDGIPVVFLHGGPGAGISAIHRRFFDPKIFRIILFDQRGSGQSRPFASIQNNTIWHLLADMERIRAFFGIDKWLIFGGSWGVTLGLAYGITYPERCLGFILRGIFLGTKPEVDWFLYGMRRFFPEAAERFYGFIPPAEHGAILAAYAKRLAADDPKIVLAAADAWASYENSCSTLEAGLRGGSGRASLSLARLEVHYFSNHCFLGDKPIRTHIDAIRHIPAIIVQGRYDIVCPPHTAVNLAENWDKAELMMVDDAGHSAFEKGILAAIAQALEAMVAQIKKA